MRPKYKLTYMVYDIHGEYDSEYNFKRTAMKRMRKLWGSCDVIESHKIIVKRYETVL
jgi:hypothetical protein